MDHPLMIEHKFPLRGDCDATLWLPRDLNPQEIARIKRFMLALATDEACPKCGSDEIHKSLVPEGGRIPGSDGYHFAESELIWNQCDCSHAWPTATKDSA